MKIGILTETKHPPDKRVALTPGQCKYVMETFQGTEVFVQPDTIRAFTNEEYEAEGISLKEDLRHCDILLGVKEVSTAEIIPGKKYLFFSHTAKKQVYNRSLLRAALYNKITLIDYEYLTSADHTRVVAFGRWAGLVGAYNGLRAFGLRYNLYDLKPAWQCKDKNRLFDQLRDVRLEKLRIILTGGGRVAQGAIETLSAAGIRKVSPDDYMQNDFPYPVCCQLQPWHYVTRIDGLKFDLHHFFNFPEAYETTFLPYTKKTDLYMACHYWDPRSPVFFLPEDMKKKDFRIKVIADISCDINGPIPSTIRASSISTPFYGYNPQTGQETAPFDSRSVTVMAVDNLPGELPRDASEDFGEKLIAEVFPLLLKEKDSDIIERATITKGGSLTDRFRYLQDFVEGID